MSKAKSILLALDSIRRDGGTQPRVEIDHLLSEEDAGKVRIDWKPFDTDTLGEVDPSCPLIWLNQSSKYLSELRRTENIFGILNVAIGMFVYQNKIDKRLQLVLGKWAEEDTSFFRIWSKILGTMAVASELSSTEAA